MRRIAFGILASAALLGPGSAWSQPPAVTAEVERYVSESNRLLDEHRAATQRNIDIATQALKAKDYAKARRYAQTLTRADPKRIEPWLMLGTAQMGLQDWKRARITYTTALRLSPGHPEARAGLGIAMARTNDPRATTQLAWLAEKVQACGGCWQAAELAKFKGQVETAIAEATTGS